MSKRKEPESISPIQDIRSLRRRHFSSASMATSSPSLQSVPEDNPHPRADEQPLDFTQLLLTQLSNPLVMSAIVPILSAAMGPMINQSVHGAVSHAISTLALKVDQQGAQISDLQATNASLIQQVGDLETVNTNLQRQVGDLECAVEELEQYGRRTSLRFHNVKVPAGADTDEVIVNLVEEKLEVTITKDDINRSHPIGKPNIKGGSQLICRFKNWKIKNQIYMSKKALKDNPDGIFITEDLTRFRQSIVSVIAGAKRAGHVHAYWTNDGRIFLKKTDEGPKHLIRSLQQVKELVPEIDNPPNNVV